MSKIRHRRPGKRLLALFSLLVFLLLVLQPAAQSIVARIEPQVSETQPLAGMTAPGWLLPARQSHGLTFSGKKNSTQIKPPGIPIGKKKRTEKTQITAEGLAKLLAESGPVFTEVLRMSNFSVKGLVKGKWPIVIEYELEAESTAEVTIGVKGVNKTFVIKLASTNDQRIDVIDQLPEEFGQTPQVGELYFRAFKNGPGRIPARFFLYGLGVGDKAVGSITINQLQFQPDTIHPTLKEKASYSFHALNDFNMVAAHFRLVKLSSSDDENSSRLVYREIFKDGVRRDKSIAKEWNGKTSKGQISVGLHQVQIFAWRGLKSGGDWVAASIKQTVKVE